MSWFKQSFITCSRNSVSVCLRRILLALSCSFSLVNWFKCSRRTAFSWNIIIACANWIENIWDIIPSSAHLLKKIHKRENVTKIIEKKYITKYFVIIEGKNMIDTFITMTVQSITSAQSASALRSASPTAIWHKIIRNNLKKQFINSYYIKWRDFNRGLCLIKKNQKKKRLLSAGEILPAQRAARKDFCNAPAPCSWWTTAPLLLAAFAALQLRVSESDNWCTCVVSRATRLR